MTSLWHVALCSPPFRTFTYTAPDYLPDRAWVPGLRVVVPVGRSLRPGVILSGESQQIDQLEREFKPLGWPLESEPLITGELLELIRHLALRLMASEGRVLAAVLPKALRAVDTVFSLSGSEPTRRIRVKEILNVPPGELAELGRAWIDGRLFPAVHTQAANRDAEYEAAEDPPWPLRPGAKRQAAILEHLFTLGRTPKQILQRALGFGVSGILKDLERKGLVRAVTPDLAPSGPRSVEPAYAEPAHAQAGRRKDLILTAEQGHALAALEADLEQAVAHGRGLVRLVHGVTGSGKTVIYLRLARNCLERGRSVLLLAPEVALSAQLWAEVCREFPEQARVWYHGYLSPGEKLSAFRFVLQGGPCIVVGTRSALFLPFPDLGLVILDEEHDGSYKQDEGLAYQAKEVAFFRIRHGGVMVLGSGTPDVRTRHAAEKGEIAMVSLNQRISGRPFPEISLVDMRKESRSAPLSEPCRDALLQVLERGEQAMLLLNRRGFAPLLSCLDCGEAPKCPHCEVGLTYHKGWERLLCHYCGFVRRFPCTCIQCGGARFLPMGEGTEALEEYLEGIVPFGQGIVRLDRDSTRRKGRLEDILGIFGRGGAQIMVGTQMLSKGHHFPNVTLVAAVDGDVGLNLPDYRAAEKTFQLLVQLAGRAGRGQQPGRVLIQTRNPGHPCWEHICRGDYQGFFAQELERRKKYAYPPFVKLGMVRFSYPREWDRGGEMIETAGDHLRREGARLGIRVLGPAPAPLGRLKGRHRLNCLLKALQWRDIREVYGSLLRSIPASSSLRVSLDLDPVNML